MGIGTRKLHLKCYLIYLLLTNKKLIMLKMTVYRQDIDCTLHEENPFKFTSNIKGLIQFSLFWNILDSRRI